MINSISHQRNANQNHIRRYYFTATMMAIIKRQITSVGKDMEKLKPTYIAGRIKKLCNYFGIWFSSF